MALDTSQAKSANRNISSHTAGMHTDEFGKEGEKGGGEGLAGGKGREIFITWFCTRHHCRPQVFPNVEAKRDIVYRSCLLQAVATEKVE